MIDAAVFIYSVHVALEKLDFCREEKTRVYAASPGSEPTAGGGMINISATTVRLVC